MERHRMRPAHWFLPRTPDLLGLLRDQAEVTVQGLEAFLSWAEGDEDAGVSVRRYEHAADDRKRALRVALTEAFTTPLEPEDLFELSAGLDEVLNRAKDTVREAEVMGITPDDAMAKMAREIAEGVRQLARAFAALVPHADREPATRAADRAVHHHRRVEHIYRAAMSALVDSDDLREVAARRELYRRMVRTGDHLAAVAERVWYAVLKAS